MVHAAREATHMVNLVDFEEALHIEATLHAVVKATRKEVHRDDGEEKLQ